MLQPTAVSQPYRTEQEKRTKHNKGPTTATWAKRLITLAAAALTTLIFSANPAVLMAETPSFSELLLRLERQPEHPEFFQRLITTSLAAENPRLAEELILKHRSRLQRPEQRAVLELLLGSFSEFRTEYHSAANYFSSARDADTPLRVHGSAMLAAVQLELGEYESALDTAKSALESLDEADYPKARELVGPAADLLGIVEHQALEERILVTQASALVALGRHDEASSLLQEHQKQAETLSAPFLLRMVELAAELGDHTRKEELIDHLAELYPDSPERHLAASHRTERPRVAGAGDVEYFPRPSRLLSPGAPELSGRQEPREEPREPTQPTHPPHAERASSTTPTAYGVQTGSFRDPENAQYMIRDLEADDFPARSRDRTVGDTVYYQVYVPVEAGDPQNLLVRLKEHGFEGFLLFE